jgi:hypothetical protein
MSGAQRMDEAGHDDPVCQFTCAKDLNKET